MAMVLHCDGCNVTTIDTGANWLRLHRRREAHMFALFGTRADSSPEPDPVLGASGLIFHDYDCLRLWLIASGAA